MSFFESVGSFYNSFDSNAGDFNVISVFCIIPDVIEQNKTAGIQEFAAYITPSY